jgi:hypothetical protein
LEIILKKFLANEELFATSISIASMKLGSPSSSMNSPVLKLHSAKADEAKSVKAKLNSKAFVMNYLFSWTEVIISTGVIEASIFLSLSKSAEANV